MDKAYTKQTFVNGSEPALNADNVNRITTALDTIDDRVVTHDSSIATNTTSITNLTTKVNALFTFDSETATLTITNN